MHGKMKKIRLFSLIVAAALLLSTMGMSAMAADMEEAKASLATVDITQKLDGRETDNGTHNYATAGDKVSITYAATLEMTPTMATYLNAPVNGGTPRQMQLMDAQFNVNINIDNLSLLEFDTNENKVTLQFSSTFLKPAGTDYSYVLSGIVDDTTDENDTHRVFVYDITVPTSCIENTETITIPAELIVYYAPGEDDLGTAYGYEGAKAFHDKPLMYADFTVADWMYPITLSLGEFRVKADIAKTVTEDPSTWQTITASGTIDGSFSYIGEAAYSIATLMAYEEPAEAPGERFVTDVAFGKNDDGIAAWTSNVVKVKLINSVPVVPSEPESPYLNSEDHFAYIIGYPDGMVHPEGNITRAEVATIFFRMLTDETRSQYWSKTNDYTDVAADDWYNNAVSTLTNLGVIEGYPDGSFQPNGPITRGEFAAIAVRFFDVEGYTWTEDAFTDIAGHWANEYINEAYLLKLVDGYPDGTYLPQNNITRAEAMTIVNNTLRRAPVKEGLLPESEMITWPDNADKTEWYYEAVQEATNSHEYTVSDELGGEQWTEALPVRDWAAFEKAWSDANSANNPGEVVDD